MKIKKGITRIVFLIGEYAIKFPRFNNHLHFLQGCYANWSERYFTKTFANLNNINTIAPTYFCFLFGLFSIQARVKPMLEELTDQQKKLFEPLCGADNKKENFGWLNDRLVCIDYP